MVIADSTAALIFDAQEITQTISAEKEKAIVVFRFKNAGTETVTIKSVQPNCECTTAELNKLVYGPGESGEISAVFTFGGHVGPQKKWIDVTTEENPGQSYVLTLRVNITEPIVCSSHLLQWTQGEESREQSILIESIAPRQIRTLIIKPDSIPGIVAHIEPQIAAGNFRLSARPLSSQKSVGKLIPCEAVFNDGTKYAFVISALVR